MFSPEREQAVSCVFKVMKKTTTMSKKETDGVADNGKLGSQSAFVNRNRIINDSY